MKTLYFEGAGCVPRGEVENCRIRTAFHDDKGQAIYLEIIGVEVSKKHSADSLKKYVNAGFVDSCFYITGGNNDENENVIYHRNIETFEYTKANILSFVNSLGCSFDAVVILPDLAGYRVFKEKNGYNYGDEFNYNQELTERAETIHKHFHNVERSEKKEYPNFSLWVDQDVPKILHLLRHFNGYNKHWIVLNVEHWQDTIQESFLGKYAC